MHLLKLYLDYITYIWLKSRRTNSPLWLFFKRIYTTSWLLFTPIIDRYHPEKVPRSLTEPPPSVLLILSTSSPFCFNHEIHKIHEMLKHIWGVFFKYNLKYPPFSPIAPRHRAHPDFGAPVPSLCSSRPFFPIPFALFASFAAKLFPSLPPKILNRPRQPLLQRDLRLPA